MRIAPLGIPTNSSGMTDGVARAPRALATSALSRGGCVGATVTIYNPDLDPDRRHAHEIVDFLVQLASYATARGR